MFSAGMLSILLALLWLSVLTRETSLFLLSLVLLAAAVVSRLWERYCLERVEYRRRFSRRQIPFGEEIEMEIEVVNRKLLPLSWLEVEDEIPQQLPPSRGRVHPTHKPGRALLASLCAFRPYERIRRRYTLSCRARGEHLFGPVRLRSGDLFGFVECERTQELVEGVVVYPRVVPLTQLGLPAHNPLGDLRTQSWIFEDVSRLAGAREHSPGDGLRRIHWPASARTQRLHSKVYEATTSHKLAILLDLATPEAGGFGFGCDPDVQELGITTAASLAQWGLDQGYQVGLYSNGLHRGGRGAVVVEAARGTGQLERILLALGRLQPLHSFGFEMLLSQQAGRLPYGATLVAVMAALTPAVAASLLGLRRRGYPVVVVLTGRHPAGTSLQGIAVRRVGPPEAWREATVLSLAGAGSYRAG
ncbi:MAG: DUF58 domain-containing protein [Chloroflexota bacterium]